MTDLYDGAVVKPDGTIDPPARRATDLPPDAPWWARWLEADFKAAWQWASVRWQFICIAAVEIYAALPDDQQQKLIDTIMNILPAKWRAQAIASVFALGILLRIINLANLKRQQPKGTP